MLERHPSGPGAIVAIGLNTFREAIRDRVLYLLLVFALIIIGISRLLSLLTVGDEEKIIKDVGLSAISLFGVMTAVFVADRSFEMDPRPGRHDGTDDDHGHDDCLGTHHLNSLREKAQQANATITAP